MRKIKILTINATSGAIPGFIEVANDYTQVFQGKYYRDSETGETAPSYTNPAPVDYSLIKATTFDIVDNPKYAGRYTVYSPANASDSSSSTYSPPRNQTLINVSELIPALGSSDSSELSSAGYITNISTYLLYTGTENIIVPPTVGITDYPIEFMGRDSAGWGEAFSQNFINVARNFAHTDSPAKPFVGQTWFDTGENQMRVWNGSGWELLNGTSFGVTFRHTQGSAAAAWTINHGLNLPAPYIAFCQFFVDRGNGPQIIIPSDVRFTSANQMTVSFSNPEIGYVLVRP